jgi:tRNA(Arg) A34 adenosine deaminase TadA
MSRPATRTRQSPGQARTPGTQDYFELLRDRALRARDEGNYAISAALVIRERGVETVAIGANTVFGSRDPSGHAEMNAIRVARELGLRGAVRRSEDDESVIVRSIPGQERESILYTTLEPCPMCTVCIVNAGIQRVVVAAEDAPSGTMIEGRLQALPPLWPELAKAIELEVALCQSEDTADTATYLAPALRTELIDIFLNSREPLDLALSSEGVLDIQAITAGAEMRLLRNAPPRT